MKKKKNKNKGFTLVEIIVVVALLVVVASIFTINMISSLNKNKDVEKNNIITTVVSAAQAYVSSNKEKIEDLYNGYGFVDIKVGELKDSGYLDSSIKDPETGNFIPDDEVVRIELDSNKEIEVTYPVSQEELDSTNGLLFRAEDLYIDYDSTTNKDSWCGNTNNIYGDYGVKLYFIEKQTREIYDGTYSQVNLKVSKCDVNPQVPGAYSITYTYTDIFNNNVTKNGTRTVYVNDNNNDIISFTAVINNDKVISHKAEGSDIPVIIQEKKKNGAPNKVETTIAELNDKGYSIENFNTEQKNGTYTATISRTVKNSNGSKVPSQKVDYKITTDIAELIDAYGECKAVSGGKCYFQGEPTRNYINYNGHKYRIYYKDGKTIRMIYDENDISGPYGQVGACNPETCCNNGRNWYTYLGQTSFNADKFKSTIMSTVLDTFYTSYIKTEDRTKFNTYTVSVKNGSSSISLSRKISLLTYDEYKNIAVNGNNKCTTKSTCSNYNGTPKCIIEECPDNYLKGASFWLADFASQNGGSSGDSGRAAASVYNYGIDEHGNIAYIRSSYKDNGGDATKTYVNNTPLIIKPTLEITNLNISGGLGTSDKPYLME